MIFSGKPPVGGSGSESGKRWISIKELFANPNCSTIQMVVALKPLADRYGIEIIIVDIPSRLRCGTESDPQRIGRTGTKAAMAGEQVQKNVLPVGKLDKHYQQAFNVDPQVDVAEENGFTLEEMKMVRETKKIFADDSIGVTATCVRVPVLRGHSESVYVELKSDYDLDEVRTLLNDAPGVVVQDAMEEQIYPLRSTHLACRAGSVCRTSPSRFDPSARAQYVGGFG